MKKICLSLLLIINVIFVSCMEEERRSSYDFNKIVPVYVTRTNTLTFTNKTNNPHTWQPSVCEANQSGWEQLDKIANMTYHKKPSTATDEFELKPIYKPAQTTVVQQEKKSLLQTNSTQPDETIMKPIYGTARNIIAAEFKRTHSHIDLTEGCVDLIIMMNNAKSNNIYESHMENFSYQTKECTVDIGCSRCSTKEKNIAPLIPIMFMLLKKYNATIQQTGEQIPLHFKRQKVDLNKTLSSPTQIYQNTTFKNYTNIYDDMQQYPALFQFEHAVRHSVEDLYDSAIKTFTTYIYEHDDISQKNYSDGSYKDFKSEFYTNAYNMLLHKGTKNDLYALVQMVDQAKRLRDITDEDDLISNTATYFSTNEFAKAKLYSLFNSSYSVDNIVKRLTLFCKLIKQYNTTKDFKINPTIAQIEVHDVKTFLDIPLPETLCNNTHLDDTFYAFKEFAQLWNDTKALGELNVDEINELL